MYTSFSQSSTDLEPTLTCWFMLTTASKRPLASATSALARAKSAVTLATRLLAVSAALAASSAARSAATALPSAKATLSSSSLAADAAAAVAIAWAAVAAALLKPMEALMFCEGEAALMLLRKAGATATVGDDGYARPADAALAAAEPSHEGLPAAAGLGDSAGSPSVGL